MASRGEVISLVVIALAMLFGGLSLLAAVARLGAYALLPLAALLFFQVLTLRRDFAARTASARLLVTRDITFVAAIVCAAVFVRFDVRWASGATIAAIEFGLILEVLAHARPSAAVALAAAEGAGEESSAGRAPNAPG